ncbi:flagellar biosynthetic protein FliR [Sulfuriflexus sp.]|uniref:flagellar biosynthetic protein FliR n=1 Tax=Sulfuriflexus sp. TaxID=2015443 RepID=UPI0028CC9DA9|nr:flagellar biosynthetic protein FliR [Sulfuriflexus sp.]MDT8403918.1 flagellar biosynthetic protein FliR [Sulfuriflexus sp.]
MNFTSTELLTLLAGYLWPLFRIAALITATAVFGGALLPMRIKLVFALALTIVIAPVLPPPPAIDMFSLTGFVVVLQQVLIGVAMGFTLQLVFSVFVLGGQVIALTMGLGFASLNDPATGVIVPTVSQIYSIFVTLVFFAINGHLVMIEVIATSFYTLPVGATGLGVDSLWSLLSWAGYMFSGAVLMALPAVASMLVVNVGFGVMTRAAPQLNIFAIGFPVIMTLGFVVILVSLPSIIPQFENILQAGFALMRELAGGR